MSVTNAYVTLAEYKTWPDIESVDVVDDSVIEKIIKSSCRYIETKTWRTFYPRIKNRLYDAQPGNDLRFDDDLLEVLSFTNGDASVITTADYVLDPANEYPKWRLKLKDTSSLIWLPVTATNSYEQCLGMSAIWGYHYQYDQRAWELVGTLGAAIATTAVLTATLTAGHTAETGQIWRIDNELLNGNVAANVMTFQKRGDNGSTAATHLINAPVYAWSVQDDIKEAAIMLVSNLEKRRAGETISSETIATAAGVLITPRDVPAFVSDVISTYKRLS